MIREEEIISTVRKSSIIANHPIKPEEGHGFDERIRLSFRRYKIDCSYLKKPLEKLAVGGKSHRIFLTTQGEGLFVLEKQ